jgi:Site-specific recombinases, DNA invertase Pin homologs
VTFRIYYRVSTEKQDFDMQDNAIRMLLKTKGIDYDSCVVYQDYGLSGTISTRPDYQKLLSEVTENDTIVVYEFSRLWRDLEEQSRATKMLLALGVSIVTVADGELNKISDTLLADIKGSINQFEARRLRERTKAGIAAKQAKVAQGLEKWKGRGTDKQKRKTDGYTREQARRRAMKAQAH